MRLQEASVDVNKTCGLP